MWLEGPGSFPDDEYGGRRLYTEQQLFYGVAVMRGPQAGKRAKPKGKRLASP